MIIGNQHQLMKIYLFLCPLRVEGKFGPGPCTANNETSIKLEWPLHERYSETMN